jgi:hypothetical protein
MAAHRGFPAACIELARLASPLQVELVLGIADEDMHITMDQARVRMACAPGCLLPGRMILLVHQVKIFVVSHEAQQKTALFI